MVELARQDIWKNREEMQLLQLQLICLSILIQYNSPNQKFRTVQMRLDVPDGCQRSVSLLHGSRTRLGLAVIPDAEYVAC